MSALWVPSVLVALREPGGFSTGDGGPRLDRGFQGWLWLISSGRMARLEGQRGQDLDLGEQPVTAEGPPLSRPREPGSAGLRREDQTRCRQAAGRAGPAGVGRGGAAR